jgi:phospholipid-binding lipoprotein MlaA
MAGPRYVKIVLATMVVSVGLIGCAKTPPPTDPAARAEWERRNDPYEKTNRKIFAYNMRFNKHVGRPIAKAYTKTVPQFFRDRIRNFSNHVSSPVTFVNDVLQGKGGRAAETATRFLVNTVAGFGGMFDVAGGYGLKRHTEDFGQTLAVWGVKEGPFLMLPLIGPTSRRHLIGRVVDNFTNPIDYGTRLNSVARIVFAVQGGLSTIDNYARLAPILDGLEKNSVDFYAAVRSLYRQNRRSEILDGEVKTKDIPLPGEDEE